MSGHSHWAGIKHKKAVVDAKRGKLFSKLGKIIAVAARDKGGDPAMNPRLRIAMETAKRANMPKENVERAIKRGTGELEGAKLEEMVLEVYGPQGVAILIEAITDNKNRAIGEVKSILSRHGAKLAGEGGVKWMFAQQGAIEIPTVQESRSKEELELAVIDAGAEDFTWANDTIILSTAPENLESVKQALENLGIKIESTSLAWVAKNPIDIGEEQRVKLEKLFEALDDYEDVQEIYSNLK